MVAYLSKGPGCFIGRRFNPSIDVRDELFRLHPLGISVFYASELRSPVASVKNEVPDIEDALDMLLRGY